MLEEKMTSDSRMLTSLADDYIAARSPNFLLQKYNHQINQLNEEQVVDSLMEDDQNMAFGNYGQTQVAKKAVNDKENEEFIQKFENQAVSSYKFPISPSGLVFQMADAASKSDNPVLQFFGEKQKMVTSNVNHAARGLINFVEAVPNFLLHMVELEGVDKNEWWRDLKYGAFPVEEDQTKLASRLPGQIVGAFIGPGAVFKHVNKLKYLKDASALKKLMVNMGTGAGIDALLTTKDTGNLSNFIVDNTDLTLGRQFLSNLKIEEDDSFWEVKAKGVGEGLMLGWGIGAGMNAMKTLPAAMNLYRNGALVNSIKNSPEIIDSYVKRIKQNESFNLNDLTNHAIEQTHSKNPRLIDHLGAYWRDQEGAIKEDLGLSDAISWSIDKIQNMTKKAKNVEDAQNIQDFKDDVIDLERAVKDNDPDAMKEAFGRVSEKGKKLSQDKELREEAASVIKETKKLIKRGKDKSIELLKTKQPKLYEQLSDVVNDSGVVRVSKKNLEEGNFIHKISDVDDIGVLVKKGKEVIKSLKQEVDNAWAKGPTDRVKRDEYAQQLWKEFAEKNGFNPEAALKSFKNVEGAMSDIYEAQVVISALSKRASEDFFENMTLLNKLNAKDTNPDTIKEIAQRSALMTRQLEGLTHLGNFKKKLASEPARALRLLRDDVQEKILGTPVSEKRQSPDFVTQAEKVEKQVRTSQSKKGETFAQLAQQPGYKGTREQNKKIENILSLADRRSQRQLFDHLLKYRKIQTKKLMAGKKSLEEAEEEVFNEFLNKIAGHHSFNKIKESVKNLFYNSLLSGMAVVNNLTGNVLNRIAYSLERMPAKLSNEYYRWNDLDPEKVELIKNSYMDSVSYNRAILDSLDAKRGSQLETFRQLESKRTAEAFQESASILDPHGQKFSSAHDELNVDDIHNIMESGVFKPISKYWASVDSSVKDKALKSLLENPLSKKLKWTNNNVMNLPSKVLNATDEYFKFNLYRNELTDLAIRQTNMDIGQMKNIDDAKFEKVYNDLFKKNLKKAELRDEALEVAREYTHTKRYSQKNTNPEDRSYNELSFGLEGRPQLNISGLGDRLMDFPGLRVIHPFTRIGYNMADFASQRFLGLNLLNQSYQKQVAMGGRNKAIAHSKMLTSAGVIGILATQFDITGGGPSDFRAKKQWMADGRRPYSVKVAGNWISSNQLGAFGRMLRLVGDYLDTYKAAINAEEEHQEGFKIGAALAWATASFATPEFLIESLHQLSMASGGQSSSFEKAKFGLIQGLNTVAAGLTPLSGAQRLATKIIDPAKQTAYTYDENGLKVMESVMNQWKNMLPYFNRDLPPVRNVLGEEMFYGDAPRELVGDSVSPTMLSAIRAAFNVSMEKEEPIYRELKDLGMAEGPALYRNPEDLVIGKIRKSFALRTPDGRKKLIKLNSQQYDELSRYSAGIGVGPATLKETLNKLVKQDYYQDLPRYTKVQVIKDVVRQYREMGREMFKAKNLEYQQKQREFYIEMAGL